ncbi:MAG: ATP-binding protein [Gemmataceae bacterium]
MSASVGMASGMASLSVWMTDSAEVTSFEVAFQQWAKACGWKQAGCVWPAAAGSSVVLNVCLKEDELSTWVPPEAADVLTSLQDSATVVWQLPNSSGRLYAQLLLTGRPAGVLWIERQTHESWTDVERSFLQLTAKLMERSAALATKVGPILEPERLQQRLQDASIIAGRMAHDFDNILTGIIGFADLSAPIVNGTPTVSKYIGEISKVGHRGIVFTTQLHQLSRSAQTNPNPGSLAIAVAKEESRLRGKSATGFIVHSDALTGLPPVAMGTTQLQVVFGHLLENAIEASPPGCRVEFTAQTIELSREDTRQYLGRVHPGTHIEIQLRDSGSGIKPDIRPKLFAEPFFTTKVRHRGLGLAIVYRVLYAHRGGIRIEPFDAPDTGTRVRVVLPLAAVRPAVTVSPTKLTTTIGG